MQALIASQKGDEQVVYITSPTSSKTPALFTYSTGLHLINMYAELITAAIALAPTTLIPRQAGPACPATITCATNNGCLSTAANGAVFQLRCRTDFNGPVISVSHVSKRTYLIVPFHC